MNKVIYIVFGLFFLLFIFSRVRKKKLSEKESIIWVLISILILILSIFPTIADNFALFIGVAYGPSFLFLTSILGLYILLLRKEEQMTDLNSKIKELAQKNAILEQRINKMSEKT